MDIKAVAQVLNNQILIKIKQLVFGQSISCFKRIKARRYAQNIVIIVT